MPAETTTPRSRCRAKKACKACNARRVRCNVMEKQPCTNCSSSNVPCELITSRRGKYDRQARRSSTRTVEAPNSDSKESMVSKQKSEPSVLAEESSYTYSSAASPPRALGQPIITDYQTSSTPLFAKGTPDTTRSSTSATVNADSTVFVGESSLLSVIQGPENASATSHASPVERTKMRYQIPDSVHAIAALTPGESRRKASRLEQLTKDGAFTFPSDSVCETLLKAYFTWFHPCFPILDLVKFSQDYTSKLLSPLLLQAVLFIGATHCKPQLLTALGISDRQEFRNTLYNRAKDIYDADFETDKITVTQALFLFSFWRAGPLLEKDTRHWLGAAISLAQTKGMHRASPTAVLLDQRLRKKIWWCLYIRDRQCSAALGLPTRIRDEDSDIDLLSKEDCDWEVNVAELPSFAVPLKRENMLYIVQKAKLAILLGQIVLREFSPGSSPFRNTSKSSLHAKLVEWEEALPAEMKASETGNSFWASTLHIAHNNLYILLYRSDYLKEQGSSNKDAGNLALQAACRNTRIVEDMLSQDQCGNGNLHLITSLFNSLCIQTIQLRRSENTARKLAEYRAQLCLLGLRELQKTWDVSNWVLQLFFQFLEQSTAQKLRTIYAERDEDEAKAAGGSSSSNATIAPQADFAAASSAASPGLPAASLSMPYDSFGSGLHFESSHLFGTKEAEDFSMFQLQPDLFNGDIFGGGLDQYYSSIFPRGDGLGDAGGANR